MDRLSGVYSLIKLLRVHAHARRWGIWGRVAPKSVEIGCASLCMLQYFAQTFTKVSSVSAHNCEGCMNMQDTREHGEGQNTNIAAMSGASLCMFQKFVKTFINVGNTCEDSC